MEIIKQLIKNNFTRGRSHPIDMIVIHVMEGDLGEDIHDPYDWFNDPSADASAHYGVDRNDHPIRQWVEEEDQAWGNGKKVRPTAKLVLERPNINPNQYTISIENEGTGRELPTTIQIVRNVELIRDITTRYNFPIDRDHIIGHHEIRADKTCPGMIDVDHLVKIARDVNGVLSMKMILKRGSRGREVEMLQQFLVKLNYMTQSDMNTGPGIFGPRTTKAFNEFLAAHGEK